jgi:hypothetical protein
VTVLLAADIHARECISGFPESLMAVVLGHVLPQEDPTDARYTDLLRWGEWRGQRDF